MTKLLVEVYARKDCSLCTVAVKKGCVLCKEARDTISKVNEEIPFQFKEVDILVNDELHRIFKEDIPTVFINGKKAFKFKVDEVEFRKKVRREIIKAGIMRLWTKKQHYS
ncbi:glutaredoxin family protein [bacterium]|nr:MAG: glutaredoxin family protein [bacterium]